MTVASILSLRCCKVNVDTRACGLPGDCVATNLSEERSIDRGAWLWSSIGAALGTVVGALVVAALQLAPPPVDLARSRQRSRRRFFSQQPLKQSFPGEVAAMGARGNRPLPVVEVCTCPERAPAVVKWELSSPRGAQGRSAPINCRHAAPLAETTNSSPTWSVR
jgi:hypothetical protein